MKSIASKTIDVYGFATYPEDPNAGQQSLDTIEFTVPQGKDQLPAPEVFNNQRLYGSSPNEKNTSSSGDSDFKMYSQNVFYDDLECGKIQWVATAQNTQIATMFNWEDPYLGNVENVENGQSSDMTDIMQMTTLFPSVTTEESLEPVRRVLSYGYYDSGAGIIGLTDHDQCWVYMTPPMQTWMGDLVAYSASESLQKGGTPLGDLPFSTFVLPGAHDAGMNQTENLAALINTRANVLTIANALNVLFPDISGFILSCTPAQTELLVQNISITQKDTTAAMLALGCRYFDFRPGMMCSALVNVDRSNLYHQHAVIPGGELLEFFIDVLTFLKNNPTEIVVVSCNVQGILYPDMYPTTGQVKSVLQQAYPVAGVIPTLESSPPETTPMTIIPVDDAAMLDKSYNYLIENSMRLFLLNQIPADAMETTKYDSYSAEAYKTTDPSTVIAQLEKMTTAEQWNYDYTVLQMQATPTANAWISGFDYLSTSRISSPLLSTKPLFDKSNLLWALQHVTTQLTAQKLVVLLNDFIEPMTVDTARRLTHARIGKLTPPPA